MLLRNNLMIAADLLRKSSFMRDMRHMPLYSAQLHQQKEFAGRLKNARRYILDGH
jgi:hypothetical protein